MKCLRGWLILHCVPLWRRENGLPAHKRCCSSRAPGTSLGLPPHSSWMPRSLLDVLLVPAPTVEGSLWPNCWIGRYWNHRERLIGWIYTGKVQGPTFRHCYAELLQLNCKHVTWQFWDATEQPLRWYLDMLRGQRGAGTISLKAVLHHHSLWGEEENVDLWCKLDMLFGLRPQRTISGLFYELIELDTS